MTRGKGGQMYSRRFLEASFACALALGCSPGRGPLETPAQPAVAKRVLRPDHDRKIVVATPTDDARLADLKASGAILETFDYGSFRMLVVDEQIVGAAKLANLAVERHDDWNRILFNGIDLDTLAPDRVYDQLPANLHQSRIGRLRDGTGPARGGLFVVQFIGPVRDEWLAELRAAGAEIIAPVPWHGYVVRADATGAAALSALENQRTFVQFVGDYEPAFRLAPELRTALVESVPVDITVQIVEGPDAESAHAALNAAAMRMLQSWRVGPYRNVELTVPSSRIEELAALDGVFAVQARGPRRRLDEVQGQISAGALAAGTPTGPGYLAWLTGKGFSASQFGTFSIHVVDDAYSLTGAFVQSDLPAGRVVFEANPTAQAGAQEGHGFLNSHIIAGYNNTTGAAFEDAGGYQYGLGMAPFARVGVSAIFGPTAATSTGWEGAAYAAGSRLSSNSWGYTPSGSFSPYKYDAYAQEYDFIVRDAQSAVAGNQAMSVVFAAGNAGPTVKTVATPATAKNIITVGAGENVRPGFTDGCAVVTTSADNANDLADFSSRGPLTAGTGDRRYKPDIVAPGTHVIAGIPQSTYDGSSVCNQYFPAGQTLYGLSSGTSHACPAVAGAAALVFQDFLNKGRPAPSPAMVKAYLANSAAHMTGTGTNDKLPSNAQGMGRMDLGRAFDGAGRILVDETQVFGSTGQTYVATGTVVATDKPFRVTLAWTDAPGTSTSAPWVNNLDLTVTVGGTSYKGNVFTLDNSVAGGTADAKNNIESVFVPAGVSGVFTVTVQATNIAGEGVPGNADTTDQDFALVIYNGQLSATVGVSPATFTFTAVAASANPAAQALSITNTATGTLAWTATDDAAWLSLASASGTAPSMVNVAVDATGLAPGTYTGTITIAAVGATNTPQTVPVTLTVTPFPCPGSDSGAPTSCNDSNPCTTDTCSASLGCQHANVMTGTTCSDGNACNGAETCNGSGVCQAGVAPNCNDGNTCTADSCSAMSGCQHAPVMMGTSCSDGDMCNGAETCSAAGVCLAGMALACSDGNACTTDSCNAMTGCRHAPVMVGTSCADANMCNGVELCNVGGVCLAGTALDCNDANACTADSCTAMGGCQHAAVAVGTSCADANMCNGAETCGAGGVCQAAVALSCDDGNPCTVDSCTGLGGCQHTPVAVGTSCSDGNACNGAELCNAGGVCLTGAALDCDDGNPCTADSCSAGGGCAHAAVANGTSCSDGNAANGAETCFAGTCEPGDLLTVGTVATQSSTYGGFGADLALDGNPDGNFGSASVTHTLAERSPWWQVDLGGVKTIQRVDLFNRTDCCGDRLDNVYVFVSDLPFASGNPASLLAQQGVSNFFQGTAGATAMVAVGRTGRYVRVQRRDPGVLSLAEVRVWGDASTPGLVNLSTNHPTTQSSTYGSAVASLAADGNQNGNFSGGSVTQTLSDAAPWWQIDLGVVRAISHVSIFNRTDCCGERLGEFYVFTSETPFSSADPVVTASQAGVLSVHRTPASGAIPDHFSLPIAGAGRYVRVQLASTGILSLAEVEVWGTLALVGLEVISTNRPASQSSTNGAATASLATDGNTSGDFLNGSVTHTQFEQAPFWEVDLGAARSISYVSVFNRTDCCGERLADFYVFASETPFTSTDAVATAAQPGVISVHQTPPTGLPPNSYTLAIEGRGRFVRVQLANTGFLSLAEVEVWGTLNLGSNLSVGKSTSQSTTLSPSGLAVDGNTDGDISSESVTQTLGESSPWWQVDLGAVKTIRRVDLFNRTDCCGDRLNNAYVFVSDLPFASGDPTALLVQQGVSSFFQGTAGATSLVAVGRTGRYVRVQLRDPGVLSLAEVRVWGDASAPGLENLSTNRRTTQSSTYGSAVASLAADGVWDGNFFDGSVTHTQFEPAPFWEIDLGAARSISHVSLFNRTDCCSDRLADFYVFASATPFTSTDPVVTAGQPGVISVHQTPPTTLPPNLYTLAIGGLGRYVRVQLASAGFLSLAEVQVWGTLNLGSNLSLGRPTSQSTTYAPSALAVDGNTDGNFAGGSVTHTLGEASPWWEVDLGAVKAISDIKLFNRTDCCGGRLNNYYIFVSDVPFVSTDPMATQAQTGVGSFFQNFVEGGVPSQYLRPVGRSGRYVRVQLRDTGILSIAEVQVWGP